MTPIVELSQVSKDFIHYDKSSNFKTLLFQVLKKKDPGPTRLRTAILKEVSFQIAPGEFVAIMGKNGAGKSTLLRLIGQIYAPDSGTVISQGKMAPMMSIGAGLNFLLSGRENISLCLALVGHNLDYIQQVMPQIAAFSELGTHLDRPLSKYSQGMLVRLFFSTMIHSDSEIFLLDEIMAVGDIYFQEKCLKRIRQMHQKGKTFILVGHNREEIKENCRRCLVINDSRLAFDGDVLQGVEYYEQICSSVAQ